MTRSRLVKRLTRPGALLLAATAAGGCAGGPGMEATTVLAYDQCQGIDTGLTRVSYEDVAGIRGSTLLNMTRSEAQESAAAPDEAGSAALLVAISRGRQPTPGYSLTLEDAQRVADKAVLTVRWQTPESGAVLAQVMTHPCLVVGLPEQGITEVQAVDQYGDSIGSLAL